tara:strand:- start:1216 stop:1488 length:273 start_codon:yes stop_codon:yes gene_type:complete
MTDTKLVENLKEIDQQQLFNTAFEYLNNKYKKVNLATCIEALESDETPQEKIFSIGWAALSLLEKGSDDFEKVESGLTNKMRKKIIEKMC